MKMKTLRRRLLAPAIATLTLTMLLFFFGLDAPHVLTLGLIGCLVCVALVIDKPVDPWAGFDPTLTTTPGAVSVVHQARLLRASDRKRSVYQTVWSDRVLTVIAHRLQRAGFDNGPRPTRRLLGGRLFDPIQPGNAPHHTTRHLSRLLDRLDALDPHGAPPLTSPSTPAIPTAPDTSQSSTVRHVRSAPGKEPRP